jgi:putative transposase
MPAKNAVKQFAPESMYHVYNRGVDKRIIFQDERDYVVFLSFLKYAFLPLEDTNKVVDTALLSEAQRFNLRRLNLANEVELAAFCLMPNHFHLLLYQHSSDGITKLMRSIATGYSLYFNKRYGRSGTLFQGRYKAIRINSDVYWQHISRYIHLNPLDRKADYRYYPYSSYRFHSGTAKAEWVKSELVLGNFSDAKQYEQFHDEYIPYRKELLGLKDMLAAV